MSLSFWRALPKSCVGWSMTRRRTTASPWAPVRCMPCRVRMPWCLRPGRALYTDGDDTFYECLEEDEGFLGGSIDLLRQATYTTYRRPSELCLYAGGGSSSS